MKTTEQAINFDKLTGEEIVESICKNVSMAAIFPSSEKWQTYVDYSWKWCKDHNMTQLYEEGYDLAAEGLGF